MQVADAEQQERHVQGEEEEKECHCRPQRDEEQDGREYEPTLTGVISIRLGHGPGHARDERTIKKKPNES